MKITIFTDRTPIKCTTKIAATGKIIVKITKNNRYLLYKCQDKMTSKQLLPFLNPASQRYSVLSQKNPLINQQHNEHIQWQYEK